jgi:hypothetical protein
MGSFGLPMGASAFSRSLASGDFTNIATNNAADGVYTIDGESVAITDIIDLSSPVAAFDPVRDIDAGGIKVWAEDLGGGTTAWHGRVLPIKEPLLSTLLGSGFTVVVEGYWPNAAGDVGDIYVFLQNADQSVYSYVEMKPNVTDIYAIDGNEDFNTSNHVTANAISKVAITVTDARMAASINGGAAIPLESAGISAAITILTLTVAGQTNTRLRSFEFYAAVADGDLPMLSSL